MAETLPHSLVDAIYQCSLKKQKGVNLKRMMDFGLYPNENNLLYSAQFLHRELPVRVAHRVIELENLPHGLSHKNNVLQISDGGGIPRSGLAQIWSYFYSTAESPVLAGSLRDMPSVMAGHG